MPWSLWAYCWWVSCSDGQIQHLIWSWTVSLHLCWYWAAIHNITREGYNCAGGDNSCRSNSKLPWTAEDWRAVSFLLWGCSQEVKGSHRATLSFQGIGTRQRNWMRQTQPAMSSPPLNSTSGSSFLNCWICWLMNSEDDSSRRKVCLL